MRLRRTGARKQPRYRVVIAEARSPRDGAFVDSIGFYDPLTEPATVHIDGDKARNWLSKGVQPSDTVIRLLKRAGLEDDLPEQFRHIEHRPARAAASPAADEAASAEAAPRSAPRRAAAQAAAPEAAAPEAAAAEAPTAEESEPAASDDAAEPEESAEESDDGGTDTK